MAAERTPARAPPLGEAWRRQDADGDDLGLVSPGSQQLLALYQEVLGISRAEATLDVDDGAVEPPSPSESLFKANWSESSSSSLELPPIMLSTVNRGAGALALAWPAEGPGVAVPVAGNGSPPAAPAVAAPVPTASAADTAPAVTSAGAAAVGARKQTKKKRRATGVAAGTVTAQRQEDDAPAAAVPATAEPAAPLRGSVTTRKKRKAAAPMRAQASSPILGRASRARADSTTAAGTSPPSDAVPSPPDETLALPAPPLETPPSPPSDSLPSPLSGPLPPLAATLSAARLTSASSIALERGLTVVTSGSALLHPQHGGSDEATPSISATDSGLDPSKTSAAGCSGHKAELSSGSRSVRIASPPPAPDDEAPANIFAPKKSQWTLQRLFLFLLFLALALYDIVTDVLVFTSTKAFLSSLDERLLEYNANITAAAGATSFTNASKLFDDACVPEQFATNSPPPSYTCYLAQQPCVQDIVADFYANFSQPMQPLYNDPDFWVVLDRMTGGQCYYSDNFTPGGFDSLLASMRVTAWVCLTFVIFSIIMFLFALRNNWRSRNFGPSMFVFAFGLFVIEDIPQLAIQLILFGQRTKLQCFLCAIEARCGTTGLVCEAVPSVQSNAFQTVVGWDSGINAVSVIFQNPVVLLYMSLAAIALATVRITWRSANFRRCSPWLVGYIICLPLVLGVYWIPLLWSLYLEVLPAIGLKTSVLRIVVFVAVLAFMVFSPLVAVVIAVNVRDSLVFAAKSQRMTTVEENYKRQRQVELENVELQRSATRQSMALARQKSRSPGLGRPDTSSASVSPRLPPAANDVTSLAPGTVTSPSSSPGESSRSHNGSDAPSPI